MSGDINAAKKALQQTGYAGEKVVIVNPAISPVLRGLGTKGWAGNYSNPKIEELTEAWTRVPTDADRARVAHDIHVEGWNDVPTVVLGRFYILSAHHRQLTGLLEGTSPYTWNVRWS